MTDADQDGAPASGRKSDAPASAATEEAPRAAVLVPDRPSYVFLTVVSIASLAADLATKAWAKSRLEDPGKGTLKRIEIISDYVSLVFAKNKGGAWGLLQEESEKVRKPFFLLISLLAIAFIFSLYRRLNRRQTALKWGLPLVLGGALGNLIDRIRYGYVIDFIDVRITSSYHWPTFNVADIAICVGVGLMAVDMFTSRKPKPVVADDADDEDDEPASSSEKRESSSAADAPAASAAAAQDRAGSA
jgi:signal peptidase II